MKRATREWWKHLIASVQRRWVFVRIKQKLISVKNERIGCEVCLFISYRLRNNICQMKPAAMTACHINVTLMKKSLFAALALHRATRDKTDSGEGRKVLLNPLLNKAINMKRAAHSYSISLVCFSLLLFLRTSIFTKNVSSSCSLMKKRKEIISYFP